VLFNINVNRADGQGGLNLNVQVEAANVLDALDKAKGQLKSTIEASGLSVVAAAPAGTDEEAPK